MKKLIFLFSLLILSFELNAQVNLDSLLNIWNDTEQVDTIRLNAINQVCQIITRPLPDSSLVLSGRMLEFANEKDLILFQAEATFQQSRAYTYKGDFEKGVDKGLQSLALFEEMEDKYRTGRLLGLIAKLYEKNGDYNIAIEYYNKGLIIAEEIDSKELHAFLFHNKGHSYRLMGDRVQALAYFEKSRKLYESKGNPNDIAGILNDIGLIYLSVQDYENAEEYFTKSLAIAESVDDIWIMASDYGNLGNIYMAKKNYEKAEEYISKAVDLNKKMGDIERTGGGLLSMANLNFRTGNYEKASEYVDQLSELYEGRGNKGFDVHIFLFKGSISHSLKDYPQAIYWCNQALPISVEINSVKGQRDTYNCLYQSYKALRQWKKGLEYHEQLLILNDSLQVGETGKKLQLMEFSKQILADSLIQEEEKLKVEMAYTSEINKKDKTRNVLMGSGLLVLLLSGGLWSRLNFTRKSRATLQIEKDRSESLLLNILPAEVAEELKLNGEALAKDFDMVSIIFTDFKGFTEASAKLSASELLEELNYCFKGFDGIMEKYGIEKIKTIGDAYMAAGGMADTSDDSAQKTVLAALEMQELIAQRKSEQDALGKMAFEMRAGIHTGPVVAGIVGVKKFQYDIWGDTVNTAARMESSGEVGKVNLSQDTYELIKNDSTFTFEGRGKIEAKGKGKIEMYFVA